MPILLSVCALDFFSSTFCFYFHILSFFYIIRWDEEEVGGNECVARSRVWLRAKSSSALGQGARSPSAASRESPVRDGRDELSRGSQENALGHKCNQSRVIHELSVSGRSQVRRWGTRGKGRYLYPVMINRRPWQVNEIKMKPLSSVNYCEIFIIHGGWIVVVFTGSLPHKYTSWIKTIVERVTFLNKNGNQYIHKITCQWISKKLRKLVPFNLFDSTVTGKLTTEHSKWIKWRKHIWKI